MTNGIPEKAALKGVRVVRGSNSICVHHRGRFIIAAWISISAFALLAYHELDEAQDPTHLGENLLNDWRTGKNTQHSMVALMRQSIFSRLAGYEDRGILETTEEVSSHGLKKRVEGRKSERIAPFARENPGSDE